LNGRFGYGEYNFVKNDRTFPTSFRGQFSLDSLNKFCRVKGCKVTDKVVLSRIRDTIPEDRFRIMLEHVVEKNCLDEAILLNMDKPSTAS